MSVEVGRRRPRGAGVVGAAVQVAVLFALWSALSDQRRPLFLALGLGVALLVTVLTRPVLWHVLGEPPPVGRLPGRVLWTVVMVGWLLWSIASASVQIAYLVLNRRRPFRPRFVAFTTQLERPASRAVLALAITLVPGTMTVRQSGDRLLVHVLIPEAAGDLASGRLQRLVARAMGEDVQPPPELHWGPVIEEAVR